MTEAESWKREMARRARERTRRVDEVKALGRPVKHLNHSHTAFCCGYCGLITELCSWINPGDSIMCTGCGESAALGDLSRKGCAR